NDMDEFSQKGFIKIVNQKIENHFNVPPIVFQTNMAEVSINFKADVKVQLSSTLAYLFTKAPMADNDFTVQGNRTTVVNLGKLNFKKIRPHSILIYCNFITPIIVGSTFARLLKTISFYDDDNANNNLMKYESTHLEFYPVSMNDKMLLSFELRTSSGELIKFENEMEEVVSTLVFREIKCCYK
ncbi:MAG TPA: hypothetical protein VIY47_05210, partial [Ignavibacteriaceae bacterium]